MPIRIATAPVSWGILEYEDWAKQKGYREVLDEMVLAGYAATELGPYGFLPADPQQLKSELAKRDMQLLGAFVPLPLAHSDRHDDGFRSAVDVARLLSASGAPFLVLADELSPERMAIAGSVVDNQHGLSDSQWDDAVRLLTRIASAVDGTGLRCVFHHHAGTFIETPAEVERLLKMTDPKSLGLCLDTGHYLYGGGDPVACARAHASRIWHLHFKDVRLSVLDQVRVQRLPYVDAIRRGVFCELGEGGVNFPGVIEELTKAGFDGWAVFEQDVDPAQPGADPLASATRSRAYLRQTAGL